MIGYLQHLAYAGTILHLCAVGVQEDQLAIRALCHQDHSLAFYASDLSNAARFASRVIDLALRLYGDDLVDNMILDACQTV